MEYILFVMQEANFYSRCILVPRKEFLEVRNEEFKFLVESSYKNIETEGVLVKNLLLLELNNGEIKNQKWTSLINSLMQYSEWGMEICSSKDKIWMKDSLTRLKSDFNHLKTYQNNVKLRKYKKKEIDIVDSFLVLESKDGKIFKPKYDTNEEMLSSLYF